MRAALLPAVRGKWEVKEVPTPVPGPNQVLIKICASGLCYTDVHITEGTLPLPLQFPCILGHEPVGEIVAVGAGVTTRAIGDRVGVPWLQSSCGRCEWCQRGKAMFCANATGTGAQMPGGHAEYMVAYADATALLPEGLAYDQAAPIFCAGYTVWSGLRLAEPQPHERIAVVGIGGLGHLAVQYAKAAGFETIAVTRTKDKEKLVRDLGADEVVADGEALRAAGGADVILATSNSMTSTGDTLKGLRPDGRLILMGLSSSDRLEVPADLLLTRGRIIGSQQNGREYLYEALDYAAKGKVKVIAETYPLKEIGRAYERVANGKVRFRAVITN
jgi:D-arabinose 1-dehydrogenase-like Zn-dependent alcohol dehydrogenase